MLDISSFGRWNNTTCILRRYTFFIDVIHAPFGALAHQIITGIDIGNLQAMILQDPDKSMVQNASKKLWKKAAYLKNMTKITLAIIKIRKSLIAVSTTSVTYLRIIRHRSGTTHCDCLGYIPCRCLRILRRSFFHRRRYWSSRCGFTWIE